MSMLNVSAPRVNETEGYGEIADRILERRNGKLRPIDKVLLHSPELADGWNSLLGALRQRLSLPGAVRELVILRIAVLNEAQYEWDSHVGPARLVGLGEAEIAAVRVRDLRAARDLSGLQRRVLELTDAMTSAVEVSNAVFDALRSDFTEVELVELVATIAAYNMVSRFAVALRISETEESS